MNFEFSEEERRFLREVDDFLEENRHIDVMDVTRENMAQVCDTPERRAFMKKLSKKGWLGITWPKEYGGQDGEGIYEYLLNEKLSSVGAPQIGKGVGIIGKTLINVGSEKLKKEFLPQILNADVEFAVGYSEPNAGSDAAAMRLKAERKGDGWVLNGQKIFTTSAHFADWYWVGARTNPDAKKHNGISLFLLRMDDPGLTIHPMPTMGGERTNGVFFDDVFVHDDYRVGELNKGFQYIAEALDIERFTLFTLSPIRGRVQLLCDYVKTATRDGKPLKNDPVLRQQVAQFATELEVARLLGVKFVTAAVAGKTPTYEASAYKLYATELSRRVANVTMDIVGAGGQLALGTEEAPLKGRAESCYTYTVIDTIGGGSSEVQKNIISKRKLGLPKNF
ncbi:MAG: acyl-CoA dehydrogenase family protein [Pseudomonadales bacterium]|nr:acyl-CoA dehydrogenase family protein [Halioglobus sp.]MCP5194745.1 acyl-CoA dehydrogenase family protein [Pseudomonadales bacterium]